MSKIEQKKSPIKERILKYADTLGISRRKFYTKIGVSRGTLESDSGITEDILVKFITVFPEIDTEWLISGRGEMLRNNKIGHCTNGDNSPISGNIEIQTYKAELDFANIKISYLEQIIKDKEEIIKILKNEHRS